MTRRQPLALVVVVTAMLAATTCAASLCPRSLEAVLDSPACSGHHMKTTRRSTIDSANIGDVCVDSLRTLLSTTADLPCTASLSSIPAAGASHTRRLSSESGAFKGKLKCKFDKAALLNVSDLSQSFIMDCEEVTGPSNYTWLYIFLGILGGIGGVCGLLVFVPWCTGEIKSKLEARRERKRQEAIDKAEAPPAGHLYALA